MAPSPPPPTRRPPAPTIYSNSRLQQRATGQRVFSTHPATDAPTILVAFVPSIGPQRFLSLCHSTEYDDVFERQLVFQFLSMSRQRRVHQRATPKFQHGGGSKRCSPQGGEARSASRNAGTAVELQVAHARGGRSARQIQRRESYGSAWMGRCIDKGSHLFRGVGS